MNALPKCEICCALVEDGRYIECKTSRYWLGHTCGCKGKSREELAEVIYYKSLSHEKLLALKDQYTQLSSSVYVSEEDKDHLLKALEKVNTLLKVK